MKHSKQAPARASIDTPVGRMTLFATAAGLTHALFAASAKPLAEPQREAAAAGRRHLEAAARALREYFASKRTGFDDLVLAPAGTPFERSVWSALRSIPYAATRSYGQVAAQVGRARASRAVGRANGRNPIAIIIPCHRVIGADGRLVGYGGGLDVKRWLLEYERRRPGRSPAAPTQASPGPPNAS